MSNFLGNDVDVVSWEFGANEGRKADGLESYLRHALMLQAGSIPPKFMLMEGKRWFGDIVEKYNKLGFLVDPLVMHVDDAVKPLLELGSKPPGVNDWNTWCVMHRPLFAAPVSVALIHIIASLAATTTICV